VVSSAALTTPNVAGSATPWLLCLPEKTVGVGEGEAAAEECSVCLAGDTIRTMPCSHTLACSQLHASNDSFSCLLQHPVNLALLAD
jgi:hypothetical protein